MDPMKPVDSRPNHLWGEHISAIDENGKPVAGRYKWGSGPIILDFDIGKDGVHLTPEQERCAQLLAMDRVVDFFMSSFKDITPEDIVKKKNELLNDARKEVSEGKLEYGRISSNAQERYHAALLIAKKDRT